MKIISSLKELCLVEMTGPTKEIWIMIIRISLLNSPKMRFV